MFCPIRPRMLLCTAKHGTIDLFYCIHQSRHIRTRDPVQYGVSFCSDFIMFTRRCTGCRCTGNIAIHAPADTSNAPMLLTLTKYWFISLIGEYHQPFKRRVKSHLPFVSIIRSSPYSPFSRERVNKLISFLGAATSLLRSW
jgi:hypothetical protein